MGYIIRVHVLFISRKRESVYIHIIWALVNRERYEEMHIRGDYNKNYTIHKLLLPYRTINNSNFSSKYTQH